MKRCRHISFLVASGLLLAGWAGGEDRVGINFTDLSNSSDHLAGSDVAGAGEFAQAHWNNVDGTTGSRSDWVDDQGATVSGITVSWDCANTWRSTLDTSTPHQKLLKGYLDDSNNSPNPGPHVTVEHVPYSLYDVVLYLGSDTPGQFDYGAYLLTDPDGAEITERVFGGEIRNFSGSYQQIPADSTNPTLAAPGGNFIVFEDLTLSGFQVIGDRTPVTRASLAGMQIVQSLRPRIRLFEADPATIDPGGTTRLFWETTNAISLAINGVDVSGQTEQIVAPAETTTYRLVAANPDGVRTAAVTVVVRDLRPVVDLFRADPDAIDQGRSSWLRWSVSNATVAVLNGIDVTGEEAYAVSPAVDTDYRLVVSNEYGVATSEVSVVVVDGVDHPVISEFVARNDSTLLDEEGDSSDWVEIYNPTDAPIDLAGYALTDDASLSTRWTFPSVILPPLGYRVIFASGKLLPLHASFQLSGSGEYLALLNPSGQVLQAFSPSFPEQAPDVSYGILGSDPTRVLFMGIPTPGEANQRVPPPADPVIFSLPDQVFSAGPLALELTSMTPDAEIRYTTDGTAPSPTHGTRYESAISITNSTVVRAIAYSDARTPSRGGVGHYVKLGADVQAFSSPLPIMVLDNFGAGSIPNKGFNQTMSGIIQVPRQGAGLMLYDRGSDGMARLQSSPGFTTRAGIRVRGSYSSTFALPPYSVEAWDGDDQEADITPLGMPPESDWILYRPREDIDVTLIYNTWMYALSNQLGRYAVRTRFVEGFVNTDGGELTLADHAGVYVLMEKVKRDRNRIPFEALNEAGSAGGWLLAINRLDPIPIGGEGAPRHFHTAGQNRIQETPPDTFGRGDDEPRQGNAFINFESPGGYDILPAQRASIEGWFQSFEDALWSTGYRDPDTGYRQYLDTASFIDYYILHNISKNGDGLLLSMWLYLTEPGAKLKMGPNWDYDLLAYRGNPTSDLRHHSDRLWYGRMFTDPDFNQEYIDRWQMHRRGALAGSNLVALVDQQATEITAPVAAAHGVVNWAANLASMKNWLVARCDAIDAQFAQPPAFNHPGGSVPAGFSVTLSASGGEIYYTLDGSDPRVAGGGISPSARLFVPGTSQVITVLTETRITARVRDGNAWSGPVARAFFPDAVPADAGNLVVSEINYHPRELDPAEVSGGATGPSDFEFLEFLNIGSQTLLLTDVALTSGVEFAFSAGSIDHLVPGERALVVGNSATFALRYPTVPTHQIAGTFAADTQLSNGGERLVAIGATGLVRDFMYDDQAPWPTEPDGRNRSLTLLAPGTNPDHGNPRNWRSSLEPDGSPGWSDALSYSAWKSLHQVTADLEDGDGDGLTGFGEYAHGTNPGVQDAGDVGPIPRLAIDEDWLGGDTLYLFVDFTYHLAAEDSHIRVEHAVDLAADQWDPGDVALDYMGEAIGPEAGTAIRTYRTRLPAAAYTNLNLRLRIEPRSAP